MRSFTPLGLIAIIVKNLAVYNAFYGRHLPTRRSKTANITKDDISLQHIAKMSLCCKVTSSFVIFDVLDLLSFFTIKFAVFLHDLAYAYQISTKRNHSILKKQVT